MKFNSYKIYFLFVCFTLVTLAGQQPGNKTKKILLPHGKQTTAEFNLQKLESAANAGKRLAAFMNRVGLSPVKGNTPAVSSSPGASLIPASKGKPLLPDFVRPDDKTISKLIWDMEAGTPRLIEMQHRTVYKGNSILSVNAASELATNFLIAKKSLLKIYDPQNEFLLKEVLQDNLGMTHVKFAQVYNGLEVWGREIYVHLDSRGNVLSLNGRFELTPREISNVNGKILETDAIRVSVNELKNHTTIVDLPEQLEKILDYQNPTAKKIIWFDKNKIPHLAWHVVVRAGLAHYWFYFVDAQTGAILNSYNNICSDGIAIGSGTDLNGVNRTFGTYQSGTTYYMIDASIPMFNAAESQMPDKPVGAIVNLDLRNSDLTSNSTVYYVTSANNQWADPASVSAHYNAIITYNYFHNAHSRNSIDDKGMTIYSIIHVTDNGRGMENAFWSGKVMCYGDGGTYFKPLAGGLDVAAHEMTHGITQYSANLEYQDQPGALNESMSDVFGSVVDSTNWTIGEQIIKDFNLFPSGAMRDMANPHNGGTQGSACWQPSKMSEFVNTTQDHGGVHINSGIPNRAFYLTATSIGRAKAAKIWYGALTNYLTRTSQFIDARIATVKAAEDLFGASSSEAASVKSAWDGVEVYEGSGTPPPPPVQLVGEEWVLVANTDPNDPNSLYMAKSTITSASDLSPLTGTPISNRPSVSDTSGLIIFVDTDYNLRALYANPQNPQETILDDSGVWWSVAVGPGLNSLALTSIYIDTTIYYIDFANNISKSFKIATKAYDAADVKTALYADALSFDLTGQLLLFDAFNQMRSSWGDVLSFWNINLLNVYTDQMESVFPPFSGEVSIGNPAFSKTSSTRFTFDYWDSQTSEDYVLAVDFNTGDLGIVVGPLPDIGYPTYSGDDRTIAFHTMITGGQYAGHDAIYQMPLKENMLEGTGNVVAYLIDATFPTWFVIGSRVTGVEEKPDAAPQRYVLYQNYPNPFNPTTTISFAIGHSTLVVLKIYDVLGNEIAALVNEEKPAGKHEVKFDGSNLSSGVYFYSLNAGNYFETKKLILLR